VPQRWAHHRFRPGGPSDRLQQHPCNRSEARHQKRIDAEGYGRRRSIVRRERAKEPVPENEDLPVIGITLVPLARMVEAMETRRDEDAAERALERGGQRNIGVRDELDREQDQAIDSQLSFIMVKRME